MPHLKKGSVLLEKATKDKIRVVGYTDKSQVQVNVELLGDANKKKDGSPKTKVMKADILKNVEKFKVVKEGEGAKPDRAGKKAAKASKPAKAAKDAEDKPAKASKKAKKAKAAVTAGGSDDEDGGAAAPAATSAAKSDDDEDAAAPGKPGDDEEE